ncbi:MAG: EAL domain-containing protein [Clostridia bacterium]|nr:EAL domain-containing protein [Clostridia bacterium]
MTDFYYPNLAAMIIGGLLLVIRLCIPGYPTRGRRILTWLVCTTIAAAALDYLSKDLLSRTATVPLFWFYLCKIGFYILTNYTVQFFYLYILSVAGDGSYRRMSARANRLIAYILMGALALFIATTPFTRLIFYVKDGVYLHGPLSIVLYLVEALLMVYCIAIMIHARRQLNSQRVIPLIVFLVVVILALGIEILNNGLRLNMFACAVGTMLIFLSLDHPGFYVYRNTGCYNANAFYEYVKDHEGETYCAVLLEPGNADYLSRTLGDEAWDRILSDMAAGLHSVFGKKRVFLIEGMCFAVVTREDPMTDVVDRPFPGGGEDPSSFRYCILPFPQAQKSAGTLREILSDVSRNLPSSAEHVFRITEAEAARLDRRILVLNAVRRALREETLDVYYQPICESNGIRFRSAEALVRMYDEELGGFVSPEEFIPIAEQNGLIVALGEYVFERVCRFYKSAGLDGLGVDYIEINLSTLQCMQPDLAARLRTILERNGIDPSRVNMEITETAQAENQKIILGNMHALIESGVTFSLDDYGSGYSSIDYLATLPVELVKIDKNIVWKAMEDEPSRVILSHTFSMLHALGLKTLAEGVETEAMADYLRSVGCDYFQGFLYAKPLPEADYLAFMQARAGDPAS